MSGLFVKSTRTIACSSSVEAHVRKHGHMSSFPNKGSFLIHYYISSYSAQKHHQDHNMQEMIGTLEKILSCVNSIDTDMLWLTVLIGDLF